MKPFKSNYCKIKLICHQKAHNETVVLESKFKSHQKRHSGEKSCNVSSEIKVLFIKFVLYVIREHAVVRSNMNVKIVI